jgi:hypothetical protein
MEKNHKLKAFNNYQCLMLIKGYTGLECTSSYHGLFNLTYDSIVFSGINPVILLFGTPIETLEAPYSKNKELIAHLHV